VTTRAEDAATIRAGAIRLGRRLRAERPQGSLSGTAVSVLSHLHREGPSTPGAIAHAEHQRPQSLTRTFRELEEAGLIGRSIDPHDRRGAVLTLTAHGRSALTRDMASRDTWLAEALDTLSPAETELLRFAATLMGRLADA
jgi:DNA-binding MarR family transcriptional regulator